MSDSFFRFQSLLSLSALQSFHLLYGSQSSSLASNHQRAIWSHNTIETLSRKIQLWRIRKEGPHNTHVNSIFRYCTLLKTTAEDWYKIPTIFVNSKLSKAASVLPLKAKENYARKAQQLQRVSISTGDKTSFYDLASDEVSAMFPSPTRADILFKPISYKEMSVSLFNDTLRNNIHCSWNETVKLKFWDV